MEGRSECESIYISYVVARVKMATSDSELLPLEGLPAVFGVFWLLGERWPVRGKE